MHSCHFVSLLRPPLHLLISTVSRSNVALVWSAECVLRCKCQLQDQPCHSDCDCRPPPLPADVYSYSSIDPTYVPPGRCPTCASPCVLVIFHFSLPIHSSNLHTGNRNFNFFYRTILLINSHPFVTYFQSGIYSRLKPVHLIRTHLIRMRAMGVTRLNVRHL